MVLHNRQAKVTDFVKKVYCNYFEVKLGDQDKPFTPHICCKTCVENLRDWRNGKRKCVPFAIPIVWREGNDHIMDYYFCMIDLKGINCKNKHHVQYLNVLSAIKPIPHDPDLPVPEPVGNIEYSSNSEHSDMTVVARDNAYKPEEDNQPVPLMQAELNDLTQDLNLSKESAQLLGSRLKEPNLLARVLRP